MHEYHPEIERDEDASAISNTAERRAWKRYETSGPVELDVFIPSLNRRLRTHVADISQGGVRIASTLAIDLGTMIRITIPGEKKGSKSEVMACVMHSAARSDGEWILGCTFCAELSDEELCHLGGKKQLAARNDQRHFERFPVRGHAWVLQVANSEIGEVEGRILNLSPTGIALLLEQPMDAGTLLNVKLTNESGKQIISILASVVYLHSEEDQPHTIGCNFIRELSEKELDGILE